MPEPTTIGYRFYRHKKNPDSIQLYRDRIDTINNTASPGEGYEWLSPILKYEQVEWMLNIIGGIDEKAPPYA